VKHGSSETRPRWCFKGSEESQCLSWPLGLINHSKGLPCQLERTVSRQLRVQVREPDTFGLGTYYLGLSTPTEQVIITWVHPSVSPWKITIVWVKTMVTLSLRERMARDFQWIVLFHPQYHTSTTMYTTCQQGAIIAQAHYCYTSYTPRDRSG
jgi:hypothetical protein